MKKPEEGDAIIKKVLKMCTEEASNPDLMDRAYNYWRMLSTSSDNTKYVVLGEKPKISVDSYNRYDEVFVEKLIEQISGLGGVYHKTGDEVNTMLRKHLVQT